MPSDDPQKNKYQSGFSYYFGVKATILTNYTELLLKGDTWKYAIIM